MVGPVTPVLLGLLRRRLLGRRQLLSATIELVPNNTNARQLLDEVDAAPDRLRSGHYGTCETCNERISERQLLADPLRRHCNLHLPPDEHQKVLCERDFPDRIGLAPPPATPGTPRDHEPSQLGRHISPTLGWRMIEAAKAAWKILRDGTAHPYIGETEKINQSFAGEALDEREREAIKIISFEEATDYGIHETDGLSLWDRQRREIEAIKLLSTAEDPYDCERAAIRLVREVQRKLLPALHQRHENWEIYLDCAPQGPVGGDYCDVLPGDSGELFLFFGDVMGKGFAGSKISSQLNGVFRALLDLRLPLGEMLGRANRIFCERVQIIGYYATLVCSRLFPAGTLELINAGHPPPLLLRPTGAERVAATGLPIGLLLCEHLRSDACPTHAGRDIASLHGRHNRGA